MNKYRSNDPRRPNGFGTGSVFETSSLKNGYYKSSVRHSSWRRRAVSLRDIDSYYDRDTVFTVVSFTILLIHDCFDRDIMSIQKGIHHHFPSPTEYSSHCTTNSFYREIYRPFSMMIRKREQTMTIRSITMSMTDILTSSRKELSV